MTLHENDIILDILIIAAILTAIGTVIWFLRGLNKGGKKISQFFEDWNGDKGDDNHAATRGVMARLSNMEVELSKNSAKHQETIRMVEEIRMRVDAELTHNHGSSIKDKVREALETIQELKTMVETNEIARRTWAEEYHTDQRRHDVQLQEMFQVVAEMIHLSEEEQALVWAKAVERWHS